MRKQHPNIRTGVIGVGSMGQNHARVYNEISNLVGVSDSNIEQGGKIAERFGIPFYQNPEELLEKINAVSISVPTFLHLEYAKLAASLGVNMLVEKPLSINPEDSKKILEVAKENNVKLAVGHIERHNPVIKHAKNEIINGKWGEIITLSSKRVSSYPDRIKDVGVVFDLGIHDLDIMSYLCGDSVESVFATGGNVNSDNNEDFVSIMLKFKTGKVGYCEINWLTPMKVRKLNINCTSSYIEMDYISQSIKKFSSEFLNLNESNLFSTDLEIQESLADIKKEEPLKLELLDFLNSIEQDVNPLVSGQDGLDAVIIANAVLESLNSNQKVTLS